MSDQKEKVKRASLAAVTEMMESVGKAAPKDIAKLLEGGTPDGEQVLIPLGGSCAFFPRKDGRLGLLTGACQRAVSEDSGRTIEKLPPFKLPDPPTQSTEKVQGGHAGFNSPAGYVKMADGRIGMTWTQTYPVGGNQDVFRFMFRTSDDDGETWSEDVRVNIGEDKGAPLFGTLRQLSTGRLIQPVRWLHWGGPQLRKMSVCTCNGEVLDHEGHGHHPELEIAYCYYSDDQGKTWSRSIGDVIGWFQDGWGNFITIDEPAVEELPDGRVLMIARSLIGRLLASFSEDGGTTWSIPEVTPLSADGAPCMMRRIPETGDLLCVWNQQSASEIRRGLRRCRLAAAITSDGKTWKHFRTFEWHPHVPERSEYIAPEEDRVQLIRALDDVGELPEGYGSSSYPTVDAVGDEVFIAYPHTIGRHPKHMFGAHKCRILPVQWFYNAP